MIMMKNNELLCAVDIGGTKSFAVLFDTEGRIISKRVTAGITPVDAPFETCADVYKEALSGICADAKGRKIASCYLSVATCEHYMERMWEVFRSSTDAEILRIEPDGLCLISAELGHADGAAMICGTGSSLYVRHGDSFYRVGGGGHLIDSCGSGFVLGRLGIRRALKVSDGRAEASLMTDLIEKKCGRPIWDDYANMYEKGRPYIASYAGCVLEAAKQCDPAAIAIFEECSSDLAEMATTARRREGKPITLILNGGIFTNFPEYAQAVIDKSPADSRIVRGSTPPVFGCAVEAMYSLGLDCGKDFRSNFLNGLK